ncbi:MAG: efflux RND transporter periplasmic adaptor subunit, partial [Desulfurispora sp.]|uniref:efflux RND transporter periplasmic adaptor subunit n=1 Tax=Desulfurispora sp. TaxID=3014275 RepID=UPI00404B9D2B
MSRVPSFLKKIWPLAAARRIWLAAALLLVVAAVIAWRLVSGGEVEGQYITRPVAYGDIVQTISASGTVEPEQQVTLTFKSQGYVESCSVKVGDRVQKGQLLAKERDDDLQAQLASAQAGLAEAQATYESLAATRSQKLAGAAAQLAQAESNLQNARNNWRRYQELYAAGAVSQAELENAQSSYRAAEAAYQSARLNQASTGQPAELTSAAARVQAARAQVEMARSNLNGAHIVAPFDGYVMQINGSVGQWTQGGAPPVGTATSSQFGIILCSTALKLTAQINEADISRVQVGQEVTFTVNTYADRTFRGRIVSLDPMASTVSNVQMYGAEIQIEDFSGLKAGMPAAVNIITGQARHVLTVPQTALDFAGSYLAARRAALAGAGRSSADRQPAGNAAGSERWPGNPQGSAAKENSSQSAGQFSAPGKVGAGGAEADQAAGGIQGTAADNTGSRAFVLVLESGQPRPRRVQVGLSDDLNVEIKSGLQEGDTVITGQTGTGGRAASGTGAPGGQ